MGEEKLYFIQYKSKKPPHSRSSTFGAGRDAEAAGKNFLKEKRSHRFMDSVEITGVEEVRIPRYQICLEKIVSE